MRLIYVTDVHGAFERVKQLLGETVADGYIIAGDLVDISFYTSRTAVRYHDLQTYFHGLRRGREKAAMTLEDFVDELLDDPELPGEVVEKGTRYRRETLHARRALRQHYRFLENIISLEWQHPVFCLPGNHDMDLQHTALRERDLHMICRRTGSLRIAGYGGAGGRTPGIPERYMLKYSDGSGTGEGNNEMYRFFRETRPHIIVSHQPAYGMHDFVPPMGESGSIALRRYCEKHSVLLCLTGHLHDQWGLEEADGTVYLNPSHFGEITRGGGHRAEGGYFFDVDVEENGVSRVRHRKLAEGIIYDVVVHSRRGGRWEQEVVDRGRYEALLTGRNCERGQDAGSRISEDALENELRRFYGLFQQTRSREERPVLEPALQLLDKDLRGDFAVDVMAGSMEGEAPGAEADLDLVLYLRCGRSEETPCSSGTTAACPLCLRAKGIINGILGEKTVFAVADCLDLDRVAQSIRERNYECQLTQRFVAYRSMARLVNEPVIAPVEAQLALDEEFRREIEGSIRSYFSIFMNTARHIRSFGKYESRLKAIGITLPEPVSRKLRAFLKEK